MKLEEESVLLSVFVDKTLGEKRFFSHRYKMVNLFSMYILITFKSRKSGKNNKSNFCMKDTKVRIEKF